MCPANVETMFYQGEVPWHGIGTRLDKLATSAEALIASGLDWLVDLYPVYDKNADGAFEEIAGQKEIRRVSDLQRYRIVGDGYTPVQNHEAFKFFDDVVGTGEAIYHTAGSLNNGARVWILAKLNNDIIIKGKDKVEKYLLLVNSHGGSSFVSFFTPIRVVCANTLAMAESQVKEEIFRARHTKGIMTKVDKAREILGITNKFYDAFAEQADFMASVQLPAAQVPLLLATVFKPTVKMLPAADPKTYTLPDFGTHVKNEMEKVEALFNGQGKGLNDKWVKGTKWAAYNAVTEYVDHYRKGKTGDADKRLDMVWFGSGADMKERALDFLLKAK